MFAILLDIATSTIGPCCLHCTSWSERKGLKKYYQITHLQGSNRILPLHHNIIVSFEIISLLYPPWEEPGIPRKGPTYQNLLSRRHRHRHTSCAVSLPSRTYSSASSSSPGSWQRWRRERERHRARNARWRMREEFYDHENGLGYDGRYRAAFNGGWPSPRGVTRRF
jgi:hypothetical protein